MDGDFEHVSIIRPGYWYTFTYQNIYEYKQECDKFPLIYLLDIHNPKNCMFGINVHKMNTQDRSTLLDLMYQQAGDITADDSAWQFDYSWFKSYFPDYIKGDYSALRYYNMKNVRELYRVNFKSLKNYIIYDSNEQIIGRNPENQEIKHDLERNENA